MAESFRLSPISCLPCRISFPLIFAWIVLALFLLHQFFLPPAIFCAKKGQTPRVATFLELALKSKSSKVTDEQYQCLYEEALAPYRRKKGLKLLEIGLGCTMGYGPGASYLLWDWYFSDVQIYIFDNDTKCGTKWLSELQNSTFKNKETTDEVNEDGSTKIRRVPILIYGDQMDREILKKAGKDHGPWDIIVDDGCHDTKCQIASFEELFGFLKPEGTFFLEDLYTSYGLRTGGTWSGLSFGSQRTTIGLIAETFANGMRNRRLGKTFGKLTCCDAICGVKSAPTTNRTFRLKPHRWLK